MDLDPLERGISILRERYAGALKLLLISVGLLLLMVCANVTGLLLTRVAGRREEIAVRLALGATRGRLVRQVLTESILLTGLGAAGGVLLASALSGSIVRVLPPLRDIAARRLALSVDFGLDWRVLLFSLGIWALTALLSGVALALSVSRTRVEGALRGARSSGGWRGRQAILVFQIALCTLLLGGAGLLVRTFEQLHSLDAGFDRDHVVTFTADPSLSGYTAPQEQAAPCCAEWARARDTRRRQRRLRGAGRDARPGNRDDRGAGGPAAVGCRFPEYQPQRGLT